MKFTRTSMAVIAMAGLLSLSPAASAQTNTPPGGAPPAGGRGMRGRTVEQQLTQLTEVLKLTDEQKPKIKAALEEQNKKMQELRGDTALSPEDLRAKRQTITQDTNKKLKEILTAEQFKKYEEWQQQQRGRGRGGAGGAGGAGGNRNRGGAGGNAGGGQ